MWKSFHHLCVSLHVCLWQQLSKKTMSVQLRSEDNVLKNSSNTGSQQTFPLISLLPSRGKTEEGGWDDIARQSAASVLCNETFIWWHWELYFLISPSLQAGLSNIAMWDKLQTNLIWFKQEELCFQSSGIFKWVFVLCSKCHCLKHTENVFELVLRELCVLLYGCHYE